MPADIVSPLPAYTLREFKTPMSTKSANIVDADLVPHSAMKGVILTSTGEPVASPTQVQFAKLFVETLKVGLNFAKTFDFDAENESGHSDGELDEDGYETDSRRRAYKREKDRDSSDGESTPHPVNRQHVERDECDIDGPAGSQFYLVPSIRSIPTLYRFRPAAPYVTGLVVAQSNTCSPQPRTCQQT